MILLEHRLAAATRHRSEGRAENALAIYQDILDISPANREALKGLGEVLLELGRIEEAARIAAQATAAAPADLQALALLAAAAVAAGDTTTETAALEQAAAVDPSHPATAAMRAQRAQAAGDMAGGERILVDALRQHPENTTLLSALSQTYMATGLLDDALELAAKAARIDPDSSANLLLLGSQLLAAGDNAAALEHFERASLSEPGNILTMIFLAEAHAALGQLTEGLRIARRAMGLRPDLLAAWRVNARIRIQKGEVAEALRELSEAVRRHKDKIESLIVIADAYKQAGEHVQALRLLDPLKERPASLNLRQKQAVLSIMRESRLSLGLIEEAGALMQELGVGVAPGSDVGPIGDPARLATMPVLVAGHMSMVEALPLLRFRTSQTAEARLSLCGPAAFAELAALLPGTSYRIVENGQAIPGVDGLPLPAIILLPTDIRGAVELAEPYLVAPEDRRAIWRNSLAHLPRPRVALSWNAGRPGLMLDDILPLFADFPGTLIGVAWDDSRHQLAEAPGVIDAGVHFTALADLAAVLAEIDALVAPDGLALHIAGAMKRPAAALLQPNTPWYWAEREGRALWYPSVRLLKSRAIGHWAERSSELKDGLDDFLARLAVEAKQVLPAENGTLRQAAAEEVL